MGSGWRHPNRRDPRTLPVELRRARPSPRALEWVREAAGAEIRDVRRLPGASSTAVHSLRLADGHAVVLRAYAWPGFLLDEPDAPQREVDALGWASRAGLPAPAVIAFDPTGADVGVPAVLMERLSGRAQTRPPTARLAEVAAEVHRTSADGFGHEFSMWCLDTSTRPPAGAAQSHLWERAQEIWRGPAPPYEPTFIHRDYHPGNVLWHRGTATGVVDWANACRGPVGVDVAHCRWNLEAWADTSVADEFVKEYERLSGTKHHPFWDIAALLQDDWDLGRPVERVLEVEARLARALAHHG